MCNDALKLVLFLVGIITVVAAFTALGFFSDRLSTMEDGVTSKSAKVNSLISPHVDLQTIVRTMVTKVETTASTNHNKVCKLLLQLRDDLGKELDVIEQNMDENRQLVLDALKVLRDVEQIMRLGRAEQHDARHEFRRTTGTLAPS